MNLIALPVFTDNCYRMLHEGQEALVVDPGDAAPAITALDARQPALAAILGACRALGRARVFIAAHAASRHWKSDYR